MQSVVVDLPENVLLGLLALESPEIPNESLPDFAVEAVENCLTTINRVRILLDKKALDADTYFKSKLYASQIDALNPFKSDRCDLRVHFSGKFRKNLYEYEKVKITRNEEGYSIGTERVNPRITIKNAENAWVEDLLCVFSDAIAGKTIYGFSDEDMLSVNIARQRMGLPPLKG